MLNMTLSKRVTEAIQATGRKPADIARSIGRTPSAISQLMDGTTKSLKADTAYRLEAETGFRSNWLISGKGPKLSFENTEPAQDVGRVVPLISWIRAGSWGEASDPYSPGEADAWVATMKPTSARAYALRVRGTSMTAPHGKSYPEGSLIIVEPERRSPVNGERIIAKLEGSAEVTFKVFKEEDGRRWLLPLNPQHEPIREPFKVLGTVIGMWVDE